MKNLIEFIGAKKGYSKIDIFNQINNIDRHIEILTEAEINISTDEIIEIAIEYSLSLTKQIKYKSIINYVNAERAGK